MNKKKDKKKLQKVYSNQEYYDFLKKEGLILFETIIGSQAYGTNTPESDVDKKFIYILPEDNIYGMNYIEQIDINKDYVGYEIKRFMELIATNNPTLLELLNSPEDCIEFKNPVFDIILENKDKFISKVCKDSFGGYARQQIAKAKGQDKMMNWEQEKVTRKDPIDFCYVLDGNGTNYLNRWLKMEERDQKLCGVVNIPNAKNMYALYYDMTAHHCFSQYMDEEDKKLNKELFKSKGKKVGLGYKGIQKEDEDGKILSNDLRLSSIPKAENNNVMCYFSYNKDGYIAHCRDYNKYQKWILNRNDARWTDVQGHGQKIDGKNMMHCMRLIDMSREIAEGKGIIIRRPNAKELLGIRKGEVNLDTLIDIAELKIAQMDILFDQSDLPDQPDQELANKLLINIRKQVYGNRKK